MDSVTAMSLSQRFMALPEDKCAKFLEGMRRERIDPADLPIPAADHATPRVCEVSAAQRRMWLDWTLQPQSAAYTILRAVRIKGRLSRHVLQRSFEELLARHESLRTRFYLEEGRAVQRIEPPFAVDIPFTSASEAEVRELAAAEEGRPFDLQTGPLMRVNLVQVEAQDHVVLIALHHIVCDGWSMNILLREFIVAYDAYAAHTTPNLEPLRIQYADFAAWQRKLLSAGEYARQLDYWRSHLGEEHIVLELPTDRPRPAQPTRVGATCHFSVEAGLSRALRALAQRYNATSFVLLLAAFQVLLHRYSGSNDIRIGVPVANRNREDIEPLVGYFVNTQVLRGRIEPQVRFDALLESVRTCVLEAQSNQDVPFDQLVEALNPPRSLAHSALFQVAHNHQARSPAEVRAASGLVLQSFEYASRSNQFDLTLNTEDLTADGSAARASFTYSTELFDRPTIERMAVHYQCLVRAIVAEPATLVGELSMLDTSELQRMRAAGSRVGNVPANTCLHAQIEAWASRSPEATAVTLDGEHLTYAALNARANQLARQLIDLGVKPETRVGICCERSLDLVVGVLAVLKAGAAYVPLDPCYPSQRLGYLMEDSGIEWLLTQKAVAAQLPRVTGITALVLDEMDLAASPATNPEVPVHPDNLAYVIYTSGSTGLPKGAQLTHRNVGRLLEATRERFHFDARDVWTLFHSYAFDFAVWEIFGALCHGGRLVIVPYEVSRTPEKFLALLSSERITVLNQTPSAFKQLMHVSDSPASAGLALRVVIFGGEALQPEELRPWMERFGDQRPSLVNMYGITETTVHVTCRALTKLDLERARSPIGEPISDLGLRVLDSRLNLAPEGVPGELYVTGAGLARGYLRRPALTAERFVADPFGAAGDRLYRTGDSVRWNGDGELEYLGRIDQQVKLRGFRIELGEIESRLMELAGIREAAVTIRECGPSRDKQLVAYVVCDELRASEEDFLGGIRSDLLQQLPDYMIPARCVRLDRMPLNANGKLDRKALPAPDTLGREEDYMPPHSELEVQLATIWCDVLKVERIGMRSNFFASGGSSLAATQTVARVRQALHIDVGVREVFAARDFGDFARRVKLHVAQSQSAEYPLVSVGREAALPLSHAQQRLWFLWKLEPTSAAFNVPAAVHLRGPLNERALRSAFNDLVRRHEILRTCFPEVGSAPCQRVGDPHDVDVSCFDLSGEATGEREGRVRSLVEARTLIPFDLERGPLLRVALFKLGELEHVLLVTIHHIIADARSMAIIVNEFTDLYASHCLGTQCALPSVQLHYADYAVWHRRWLESAAVAGQLAYWQRQLAGAKELELPTDRPRSSTSRTRGAFHRATLDDSVALKLRAMAHQRQITLFTLLLSASAVTLRHRSGQSSFLVGTNVDNRARPALESVVGFFVNQLVLKIDFANLRTSRELCARLQETLLDALEHQDLPFDRLVDALRPQRRAGRAPFFNVKIIHQAAPAVPAMLAGLQAREFVMDRNAVEQDLILEFAEAGSALHFNVAYNCDLFDAATIACIADQVVAVLEHVVAHEEADLDGLDAVAAEVQRQRYALSRAERSTSMQRLRPVSRRRTNDDRAPAVFQAFRAENELLAVCTPTVNGTSLSSWAATRGRDIDAAVKRHGAVLFRGFDVGGVSGFNQCVQVLGGEALEYRNRSSPRTQVDPALRIYTSTEYPAQERIFPHNENSYAAEFPLKLFFYCDTPAQQGGETPVGDVRRVLHRMDPDVREQFQRRQVLYVRNFGEGIGLSWQQVFQTSVREQVESYCAGAGIQVQWLANGGLRTRRRGPAIVRHPGTGELSWFNHATFFNSLTLPEHIRDALTTAYAPDELPQNTFYGDGAIIEAEVMAHLQQLYREAMIEFTWQQGDMLMLDNLTTAHARNAFTGMRRILVGMAGVGRAAELEWQGSVERYADAG
jgi:amino acid adenylation domain-containing protein